MADKFPIKALQEMIGLGATTTRDLKIFAKEKGLMNENGSITEKGKEDFEYRYRKYDGEEYLAASKEIAEQMHKQHLREIRKKYNL